MRSALITCLFLVACGGSEAPAPAPAPPPKVEAPAPTPTPPPAEAPAPPDATAAAAAPDAAGADGAAVYNQYCIACHQADGKGMNGTMAGNYVDDPAVLAQTDEQLIATVKAGKTGKIGTMPPWGGVLSDAQVAAVVAYIRATYGKK